MDAKEKAVARELADQIFSVLHDAESAVFIIGDLHDEFFSAESADTPEGRDRIALKFDRAQKQFSILVDYACKVRNELRELDAATER